MCDIEYVAGGLDYWQNSWMQAFTEVFEGSKAHSATKLTCLCSMAEILLPVRIHHLFIFTRLWDIWKSCSHFLQQGSTCNQFLSMNKCYYEPKWFVMNACTARFWRQSCHTYAFSEAMDAIPATPSLGAQAYARIDYTGFTWLYVSCIKWNSGVPSFMQRTNPSCKCSLL